MEWGVESEDIVLETKATDTKDHPIYVKEIVGRDRFILVTSASHMPRAMALFRQHGMEPIPAPTDYMVTPVKYATPLLNTPQYDFPNLRGKLRCY